MRVPLDRVRRFATTRTARPDLDGPTPPHTRVPWWVWGSFLLVAAAVVAALIIA